MKNKFHVLDHPMLLFTGTTETGRTKDLQPGVIGVFDDKSGQALNGSTLQDNRPVKFAQGSYHTKDALGAFYTGLKKSLKTADFLPKDVYHIEYSAPQERQNEKWILGWDGLNDCESLKFECGKTHKYRIRLWGEGVYNDFAKQIMRDVQVTTDCCDSDDCADGCPDDVVHCRKYTKMLVDAINNDVEISKFVKAEVVLPEITAKVITHKLYCMSTCDNGDQEALNAVRAQYPGVTIERTKREGSISTYETGCLLIADAPVDYNPTGSVFTSICGACEAGQTLIAAQDVWVITRIVLPTDDLSTPALQAAFATAVQGDYPGATESTFLSTANGMASIEIKLPEGTAVTSAASDNAVQSQTIAERCSLTGAAAVAWAECGDRYIETRELCIILPFECDTFVDRSAEIAAFYANGRNNVTGVVLENGGVATCEASYRITQESNCLDVACLSEGIAEFETIEPFEGKVWEECPCEVEATPTEANTCGIRLEVNSSFDKFDNCSWVPEDYYTYKPVFMEIWEVLEDEEGNGDFCQTPVKARKIQEACQENQTGEWVAREYIALAAYLYHEAFNSDPRLRTVLDQTVYKLIDRDAKYHVYYVKYKQYRGNTYVSGSYDPEIYEIPIVVKDGVDRTGLETWLNGMFSKYGVTVQPRLDQPNY